MSRERGFTLLELLTTVAVIAILASIALPSFGYLSANTKIKSASTELYLSMLRARSEAVKRSTPVNVGIKGANWAAGWVVYVDTNANNAYDSGTDRLLYDSPALVSVSVTVVQPSGLTGVTYLTSGRLNGTVPKLQFAPTKVVGSSITRCVSADITGRPYVQAGACS